MAQGTVDGASAGFGAEVLAALRGVVATFPRRCLVGLTALAGLVAAAAVTAVTPAAERTLAELSEPVQSLMSIAVPLIGITLAGDLRRAAGAARVVPTLLSGALVAAAIGAFGVLVCAVALAVAPAGPDAWRHSGTVAAGGVLVQVVAVLVGSGLGLLLRPAVVAFLATIVLPIGLYVGLGAVEVLRPAQAWLTPYASVRHLLDGDMSPLNWAQWLVVFLLWGVGLNAAGSARLR